MSEFQEFQKIARLTRDCVITEKIDGTNAQIEIRPEHEMLDLLAYADRVIVMEPDTRHYMLAGSRTRYITPTDDNFGFAAWVKAHADELWALGEGRHYGEWWGSGIQRGYGLPQGEKRFSLFNVGRWVDTHAGLRLPLNEKQVFAPECCYVVPVLYSGVFSTEAVGTQIERLRTLGSAAALGFDKPEGVVVWHEAARQLFKKTLEKDEEGKEQKARRLAHA